MELKSFKKHLDLNSKNSKPSKENRRKRKRDFQEEKNQILSTVG